MPSIKFTEIELEFLRNHYEQELIDAEMYVAEIRRILSKLGKSEAETILGKPEKKRRGRPSKKKAAAETAAPAPAPQKEKKSRKPLKKKAKAAKGKAEPKPVVKKAVKKSAPKKKAPKKAGKPAEIATPAEQSA